MVEAGVWVWGFGVTTPIVILELQKGGFPLQTLPRLHHAETQAQGHMWKPPSPHWELGGPFLQQVPLG